MYFYRAALPGPPLRSGFINRTRLPLFPSAFIHLSSLSHICKPLISLWLLYIPHSPYRDVEVDSLHSSIVSFSRAPVILSYSSLYSTYYPLYPHCPSAFTPFSYSSSYILSTPLPSSIVSNTHTIISHPVPVPSRYTSFLHYALSILPPFFTILFVATPHPFTSTSASVPTFFRRRINFVSVRRAYPSSIPSTTRRFPIAT